MLYNPKWEQPSLVHFIAWLETMPADAEYEYTNFHICALAQYAKKLGDNYPAVHLHVTNRGQYNYIVSERPWTYGAALRRSRKALATNESC